MKLFECCKFEYCLVDLIFFLYKAGESMLDATSRPYIVEAVCEDRFPHNSTICKHIENFSSYEDEIQQTAAAYLMYYRILINVPAILLGLFCGAYSDKYGRKIPMMLPSIGSVLSVMLYMLSVIIEDFRIPLILIGSTLQGMFGKSSVITMAVNSYASDITDAEHRTKKLGKLLGMNFFGLFAGSLLSGVLQDLSDIVTTFCSVVFIHAAVVILVIVAMKETVEYPVKDEKESECLSIFKISNVKDSFRVLTKKRASNTHNLILLLFCISLLNQICKVGEMDVTVLFVERSPLNWPRSWYGYLLSVDYAVMGTCLLLVLPVLSGPFNLPDCAIIIIGLSCKVVRLIWAGFCRETWMVYTSVVIGSFAGMITSAIRSLVSKAVDEDEVGKMFSLLASAETASKLFGIVIFVGIYGATASFFPGFAYILEAIVYVFMLLVIILMYSDLKGVGKYDLMKAFSEAPTYGSNREFNEYPDGKLPVVDELEEQPTVPLPVPANTP